VAARAEVRAQRLAERNDLSVVKDSPLDLQMARIEADYVLTNNGSLGALEAQVDGLCRLLVGERAEAAA
jgi:cytidine deaminase